MKLEPSSTNEQLQKHKVNELYLDATERRIARKSDFEAQKGDYSGKKSYTVKNSVICNKQQYIFFAWPTCEGKHHDKTIADQEALSFPEDTKMWTDLGYEAPNLPLFLPHKRPKGKELSDQEKQQNTEHAKERVCNEHAMRGIKRLRIVQNQLRLCAYKWADNLFKNACGMGA